MQRSRMGLPLALAVFGACCTEAAAQDFKTGCERLVQGVPAAGRVTEATFVPAGPVALPPPAPPGAAAPAPDHCLVRGKLDERTGIDGKPYAIGYEVRLPASWNGKFIFEGGGGSDGVSASGARCHPVRRAEAQRPVGRLCGRHYRRRPPRRARPDRALSVRTGSEGARRQGLQLDPAGRGCRKGVDRRASMARRRRDPISPAVPMVAGRGWP